MEINQLGNVAHYSRLGNLANILHDKRIMLGCISNLADPRENTLGWLDSISLKDETAPELTNKFLKTSAIIKNVGSQLKIFCTVNEQVQQDTTIESTIYGRPRMWSQYGENSKGFCLVLKKKILDKHIQALAKNKSHLISGKVEYCDWLYLAEHKILIEYGFDPSKEDIFTTINTNKTLESIFFRKGIDWQNENEYRWLLFTEDSKSAFASIEGALEAVVLGFNFPHNQITQAKMYCNELGCPCFILDYRHPKYLTLRLA